MPPQNDLSERPWRSRSQNADPKWSEYKLKATLVLVPLLGTFSLPEPGFGSERGVGETFPPSCTVPCITVVFNCCQMNAASHNNLRSFGGRCEIMHGPLSALSEYYSLSASTTRRIQNLTLLPEPERRTQCGELD